MDNKSGSRDQLSGYIDAARPCSELDGNPLEIKGWALDGKSPAASVLLLVNGIPMAIARTGLWRKDVATRAGENTTQQSGWQAFVRLHGITGAAEIVAVAFGRDGRSAQIGSKMVEPSTMGPNHWCRLSKTETTPRPGPRGELLSPSTSELTAESVFVQGWVLFGDDAPARVEIEIDGEPTGRARTQVVWFGAEGGGSPNEILSGFEHRVEVDSESGEATRLAITVVAYALDGRVFQFPTRVVTLTKPAVTASERERTTSAQEKTASSLARVESSASDGIVIFTHDLSVGGAQLYLQDLIAALRSNGHNVRMVVSAKAGPISRDLEAMGIEVKVSPLEPTDVDSYEKAVEHLALLCKTSGCRVALLNTTEVIAAADAAERAGLLTFWAIHESGSVADWLSAHFGEGANAPYMRERYAQTLSNATALIFESDSTSALYEQYVPDERRFTIPYGIDVTKIEAWKNGVARASIRARMGINEGSVVFLNVGVLAPRKGQASLIEAFRAVSEDSRAELVLVGDFESQYSNAIHAMVSGYHLEDRVHIFDITESCNEWYAMSDFFVCSSDVESVPRTVLESMAFHLPVLATDAFGLQDVVKDGLTGFLTRSRDLEALEVLLERALTITPDDRKKITAGAFGLVRDHWNITNFNAISELISRYTRQSEEGALTLFASAASTGDA